MTFRVGDQVEWTPSAGSYGDGSIFPAWVEEVFPSGRIRIYGDDAGVVVTTPRRLKNLAWRGIIRARVRGSRRWVQRRRSALRAVRQDVRPRFTNAPMEDLRSVTFVSMHPWMAWWKSLVFRRHYVGLTA